MKKLYAERDIENLDTYCDHVSAMTGERLHSKSAIAAELAFRDHQVNELKKQICIYARENMTGYVFNSDQDVLGFFEEHAKNHDN